jgi:hypothetical protein
MEMVNAHGKKADRSSLRSLFATVLARNHADTRIDVWAIGPADSELYDHSTSHVET